MQIKLRLGFAPSPSTYLCFMTRSKSILCLYWFFFPLFSPLYSLPQASCCLHGGLSLSFSLSLDICPLWPSGFKIKKECFFFVCVCVLQSRTEAYDTLARRWQVQLKCTSCFFFFPWFLCECMNKCRVLVFVQVLHRKFFAYNHVSRRFQKIFSHLKPRWCSILDSDWSESRCLLIR